MNLLMVLTILFVTSFGSYALHLSTFNITKEQREVDHNSNLLVQQKPYQPFNKRNDLGGLQLLGDHYNTSMWSSRRDRRQLSNWLIAPNTRWCGRGNTANGTYNHLGGASSADKCCRKHDHCQLFIPGMSNRYELFNYRPYTLSHCNCDRRFRTCLKMANDEDAKTIGKLFFNMVQSQCFILKTDHVCQQRSADGTCERELARQKAYLRNNKKF